MSVKILMTIELPEVDELEKSNERVNKFDESIIFQVEKIQMICYFLPYVMQYVFLNLKSKINTCDDKEFQHIIG